MSTPGTTVVLQAPSTLDAIVRDRLRPIGARIGARRIAIALGAAAGAAGIALNWGWLTAIGVTPVLAAAAPCAAMCALGLCLHRIAGGSRAATTSQTPAMQRDPPRNENSPDRIPRNGDLTRISDTR
jgi:hypothetical protein